MNRDRLLTDDFRVELADALKAMCASRYGSWIVHPGGIDRWVDKICAKTLQEVVEWLEKRRIYPSLYLKEGITIDFMAFSDETWQELRREAGKE